MAFANVTEENIASLLSTKDSKSTQRAINRSVKRFRDFLIQRNESGEFEQFTKVKLDEMLRLFYASIRKKGGELMKKSSINLLKYGLSKYVKDKMQIDINIDPAFASSKGVFSAVLSDLKKKGLGAIQHKPAICREDLIKLYDSNGVALNPNTREGLLHKCWFDVMTFLCRRGRENLREMTRETFQISTDGSGRKFVMQVQDENNKNRNATDDPNDTIGEGRMYERPGDPMCPVASFEKYISKLHPENLAFWQLPCNTYNDQDYEWYTRAPLGKNTLNSLMSDISKLANLSVNYTNHSIRATSITELDEAGVASRHIMRVSGHKSESSIKHYSSRLSEKKKREISDCLSNTLTNANSSNAYQKLSNNVPNTIVPAPLSETTGSVNVDGVNNQNNNTELDFFIV